MWYAKVVCEVFDCGRRAQQLSVTSAEYTYISPACRGCATHACEMAAPKPAGNKKATGPPEDIPAAKNSGGSRAGAGRKAGEAGPRRCQRAKTTGTQLSLGALSGMVLVCQTTFDCLGRVF